MKILTELQQKVLDALFALPDVRRHFYLTGGTALSGYYYNHRLSDDLDLFTHSISIESIDRVVSKTLEADGFKIECRRQSPGYRRYLIDGSLQLDLVKDVDFRAGAPELFTNIMVDCKKNIAVNKVLAIYGRLDPKDYIDLYFLIKNENYDILELIKLGQHKDAGLEPFQWAKVIADAQTISVLPRMISDFDLKDLKNFFDKLRDKIIDSVKP